MDTLKAAKVPPEGSWGYLVAAANVVIFIIIVSPLQHFGIIYGDFFESLGGRTSNIALTLGAFNLFLSITGLFVNILFKIFSCRQICLAGASLYTIANIFLIFVSSLAHIMLTHVVIGISVGLMFPAVLSSLNGYFVKKRLQIFLATKPFVAIGTTCYPLLVHGLRELYGFQGMMAVLCAINMHGILAAILLQPVKRYLNEEVTIKDQPEEAMNLLQNTSKPKDIPLEECIKMEPLLNMEIQRKSMDNDGNKTFENEDIIESLKPKSVDENQSKDGLWQTVNHIFDLTLFKDLRYVNMLTGITFAEFSFRMFLPLLPIYLEKIGWSKADISLCISGAGLADLASTTILAISAPYYRAKSRHLYLVGVLITIVARIAFIYLEAYTPVFIVLCVIWFFRTWMIVSFPMVFAEHVPPQRFPAAYGMFTFVQGINSLFMNVVAGFIRDATGSYIMCFYFLIFCLLICAIPWTIEILWMKIRKPQISIGNK